MQNQTPSLSLHARRCTDSLLVYFTSLVDRVTELEFPTIAAGLTARRAKTGWTKTRRVLNALFCPDFSNAAIYTVPYTLLWLLIALTFILVHQRIIYEWLQGIPDPAPPASPNAGRFLLGWGIFLTYLFSAGWRWKEFFADERYARIGRIAILVLFLAALLVALYAEFLLAGAESPIETFTRHPEAIRPYVQLAFLILLPALAHAFFLILELIIYTVKIPLYLIIYLRTFHIPFQQSTIREILYEPVPASTPAVPNFRLLDLHPDQLAALRQLAASNREGTDKRLLLSAIFLAFMGIIVSADFFREMINNIPEFIRFILNSDIKMSIVQAIPYVIAFYGLIIGAGLFVAMIFFVGILLRSLAVQSRIVEACIVAEYTLACSRPARSRLGKNQPSLLPSRRRPPSRR